MSTEKTSSATSEKTSEPTADAEAAIILAMGTGEGKKRPSEKDWARENGSCTSRAQARRGQTERAKVIMEMLNLG